MASLNPAKFIREVRQEMTRVTWPTRKETTVSTLMVLVMVALAATFFVIVDMLLHVTVNAIIGI